MSTDEEFEYAITCGLHDQTCDPNKVIPEFGIFKTRAEAAKRAQSLNGRVMKRAIGGPPWLETTS